MDAVEAIRQALAFAFIAVAVFTDCREYRIKNASVLACIAAGLLLNGLADGPPGLASSALGLALPLALFPLFALAMLGAGDIKALCAVGSVVGWEMGARVTLLSFVAGGLIAVAFMLARRNALERARQFGRYLKLCIFARALLPYGQFTDEKSGFRFSFGILGAYIATLAWSLKEG